MPQPLILVSNHIEPPADAQRPRFDYHELAHVLGASLLGYSSSGSRWHSYVHKLEKSLKLDLTEVAEAYRQRREVDYVLSLSEKAGILLALALMPGRQNPPHVLIAHKLTSGSKTRLLRALDLNRAFSSIICVSKTQVDLTKKNFGVAPERIHFVYDKVDHHFFRPQNTERGDYVLAVGQEQRDYSTLIQAVHGTGLKLIVVASSPWSTSEIDLGHFDADVELRRYVPFTELRALYDAARLVVVPLRQVDYAAGVNTLLEAMAMAKPVVITQTSGIEGYIVDQETGLYVQPGDPHNLRETILRLWDDTREQARLGANARQAVEENMNLDTYVSRIAGIIQQSKIPLPR